MEAPQRTPHTAGTRERRITFVKVGRHVRIPESAVDAFVAAHTVEPITGRTSHLKAVA